MTVAKPLVVDLDGTLAATDTLHEAIAALVLRQPARIPQMIVALLGGPARLKQFLVQTGSYGPDHVPLRADLVDYIEEQRATGRDVHLVTAAPQAVADAVSSRVGLFDSAEGTQGTHNLKGEAKLAAIRARFPDGFTYAGNDRSDVPIWRRSSSIIVAGSSPRVAAVADQLGVPVEQRFPDKPAGCRVWLKAIRLHQWVKNALMFVPLVLAHRYGDLTSIASIAAGFVCMGLMASATYLLNDASDLAADRQHATKRFRPLASGAIPIGQAALVGAMMGIAGLAGAFELSVPFALLMILYTILTVAYSLRLKAIAILDVFVLGLLFTLRIVMGLAIIEVPPSPWLLVFSMFFFFSLSIAKRHTEIVRAASRRLSGTIKGRGYRVTDEPLTLALGMSSSVAATMMLFLYVVNDAYPKGFYKNPEWLWCVAFLVFLWTCRIWLKSHRGKLDDDPIVFALKDPPSWAIGAVLVIVFVLAVL